MEIRLISTLTLDDEARLAETICATAGQLLDQLSIMYTMRIETISGQVFQRNSAPAPATRVAPADVAAT
jgi:hypothetical protein